LCGQHAFDQPLRAGRSLSCLPKGTYVEWGNDNPMARRKYRFSKAIHAKRLKEGQDQGKVADYQPYIYVQDLSSRGRLNRDFGSTTADSALVADAQAAEAIEPRDRPLRDPPVPRKPLATLDAAAGDARREVTAVHLGPQSAAVVSLVDVQLHRMPARPIAPAPDGRDGVYRLKYHARVVHML
jgi:hypothetical protein